MTEATLTFDDSIEEYIREIVREEIKAAITDQVNAVIKTVVTTVAKTAAAALAKGQAPQQNNLDTTINTNQFADAIKARLAEKQRLQAQVAAPARKTTKPRKAAAPKETQ